MIYINIKVVNIHNLLPHSIIITIIAIGIVGIKTFYDNKTILLLFYVSTIFIISPFNLFGGLNT